MEGTPLSRTKMKEKEEEGEGGEPPEAEEKEDRKQKVKGGSRLRLKRAKKKEEKERRKEGKEKKKKEEKRVKEASKKDKGNTKGVNDWKRDEEEDEEDDRPKLGIRFSNDTIILVGKNLQKFKETETDAEEHWGEERIKGAEEKERDKPRGKEREDDHGLLSSTDDLSLDAEGFTEECTVKSLHRALSNVDEHDIQTRKHPTASPIVLSHYC